MILNYLRQAREQAGMSVRGLARRLGVSAVYLSEVERGISNPLPRKHWPALCEALPVFRMEVLEGDAAVEAWAAMTTEQRAAMLRHAPESP